MKTELDDILDWYMISLDIQQSMKQIIRRTPGVVPRKSLLHEKSMKETVLLIDKAISELNKLTIIAFVSVFERLLIETVKEEVRRRFGEQDPIITKMQQSLLKKAERLRFEEIIDFYKPRVGSELCGLVKQVYRYRNELAHPGGEKRQAVQTDPLTAYEYQSGYIQKISAGTHGEE